MTGSGVDKTAVVVLDVGKTLSKLTLWCGGKLLDRRVRPNGQSVAPKAYPCLDVAGIGEFLAAGLADFARQAEIAAIIPVAHGAGVVLVEPDGSAIAPLDYEAVLPDALWQEYQALRPSFAESGSPGLPCGLNLGAQLHWLQAIEPERFSRSTIVPWAQYWAFRLSGVAASEVTSFGVHTDLWNPGLGKPSSLAQKRGWSMQFAPLRRAFEVLGGLTPAWCERTGISPTCRIYCGIHDSNADLLAVRAHPEIGASEHTVVSTGTWFIAMRSAKSPVNLPSGRDCLINIDAFGQPVPSSRFMGGRETELLEEMKPQIDLGQDKDELLNLAEQIVTQGAMALPAFQSGVGPFPTHCGHWILRPETQIARRVAAGLYLALMLDTTLNLIGASEKIVIGGRFQADLVFTRALAALRPRDTIYLSPEGESLCRGALSLVDAAQIPQAALVSVKPLDFELERYAERWRNLVS
jgi:Sugar (pentulose and hexulose) kinases